mmetsp:Transcript_8904/g.15472  ORF Transcript_8904/g.15472 Transcript_8904/m.15472 type:complete len:104 (+) Transcript_8904:57-368(+)
MHSPAPTHYISTITRDLDPLSGQLQTIGFEKAYRQNGGFTVALSECNLTLRFEWMELIHNPNAIMFFGNPFESLRPFYRLFRWKTDEVYIFHVFKEMAREYRD